MPDSLGFAPSFPAKSPHSKILVSDMQVDRNLPLSWLNTVK